MADREQQTEAARREMRFNAMRRRIERALETKPAWTDAQRRDLAVLLYPDPLDAEEPQP